MHSILDSQLAVMKLSLGKEHMNEEVNKRMSKCQNLLNVFESHGWRSPRIALSLDMVKIHHNPPSSLMNCFQGFLDLADRAHECHDYFRERQNLVEAGERINEAILSCEKRAQELDGLGVSPDVPFSEHEIPVDAASIIDELGIHSQELARRQKLADELRLRRLSFEADTTRSALCLGAALSEFSAAMVSIGKPAEFLKYFEDFKDRYSGFDVPWTMYVLNMNAERAAGLLNNQRKEKIYRKAKEKFQKQAFQYVTVDGATRLTLEAQNHPNLFQLEVHSPDQQQLMLNVVRKMLEWATIELTEGRLANIGIEKLFKDAELSLETKTFLSLQSDSEQVYYALDPLKVASRMYGYGLEPTPRNVWLSYFEPVEAWLRNECQVFFEEQRNWLLKMLQQSRCNTLQISLRKSTLETGRINDELCELLYQENLDYARILGSIHEGARGSDNISTAKRTVMASIIDLSFSVTAIQSGLVTDAMLRQHNDVLGPQVCEHYQRMGEYELLYRVLRQRSLAARQRFMLFRTVQPDAALPYLEEADRLYCKFRQNAAASQFHKAFNATYFQSKFEIVQRLGHHEVYSQALSGSLFAYLQSLDDSTTHPTRTAETTQRRLANLSNWVERSKARSLLDELGIGARVPKRLLATAESRSQYGEALSKETTYITQLEAAEKAGRYADQVRLQNEMSALRAEMLSEAALKEVMDIREGVSVTMSDISKMLDNIECGTTLVSYAHVTGQTSSDLWIIHYRRGMQPEVRHTIRMEQVNVWISQNLDCDQPFSNEISRSKLDDMNPLVES